MPSCRMLHRQKFLTLCVCLACCSCLFPTDWLRAAGEAEKTLGAVLQHLAIVEILLCYQHCFGHKSSTAPFGFRVSIIRALKGSRGNNGQGFLYLLHASVCDTVTVLSIANMLNLGASGNEKTWIWLLQRCDVPRHPACTTRDDVTSCLFLLVNLPPQRRKSAVPKIAVAEQESGFDLWSSKAKKC